MHTRPQSNLWRMVALLFVTVILMLGASVALATSSAEPVNQPPPPPSDTPVPPTGVPPAVTPGPGGNGGTGFLAVLEGNVWEEGDTFRPLAGTKVRYTSEGVSVDVLTDKNGFFRFVNIGPDPGTLDLADSDWQSGTGGVVVKPLLGQTLRINLAALPKGKSAASKVTLASSASAASASAGQIVTFTFKVTNGTASAVSGLTLGDQLPDGFTVAGVTTSRGDVIGRGPNLVMVDLNALSAGDSATVNIIALVNKSAATVQTANRATLAYREGPAISAQTGMTLAAGPATLPKTGVGLPIAAAVTLVVILLTARWLRARPAM
jgi:uncharacterized repeat protein (TIGR01451 family)